MKTFVLVLKPNYFISAYDCAIREEAEEFFYLKGKLGPEYEIVEEEYLVFSQNEYPDAP